MRQHDDRVTHLFCSLELRRRGTIQQSPVEMRSHQRQDQNMDGVDLPSRQQNTHEHQQPRLEARD